MKWNWDVKTKPQQVGSRIQCILEIKMPKLCVAKKDESLLIQKSEIRKLF